LRTSINQTGRRVIPSDRFTISLKEKSEIIFTWNLAQDDVIEFSEAILELSSFGGIHRFIVPITKSNLCGEYQVDSGNFLETRSVVGRLKLIRVNSDSMRFISAESKILRLQNEKMEGDHGRSLLDVYYDPMLKSPWQLVFDDAEPVLKVSNYFDNATKIYTNSIFQTSILPEVVRQVAFWLITEDPNPSENSKIDHWWNYLAELGLDGEARQRLTSYLNRDQEYLSEVLMKTQELADSFAARFNILQKLVNSLEDDAT